MQNADGWVPPMELNLDFLETSHTRDMPLRKDIGSLLYISVGTRPDIVVTVARMAKFVDRPTMIH